MAKKKKKKNSSSVRDIVKKRAGEQASKRGGSSTITVPEEMEFVETKKKMTIDILPYTVSVKNHPEKVPVGEDWYRRQIYVHRNVGPEEKWMLCPRKNAGKACPICEEQKRLANDPDADEKVVKALRASEREIYNVIDLKNKKKEVMLWEIASYNFGQLLAEELDEGDEDILGFFEQVDGRTLSIRFKTQSFEGTNFLKASRIDFEERDEYGEEELEGVVDLDTVLIIPTYKELEREFKGMEEEGEEEEEDDLDYEMKKKDKKSKKKKKAKKKEDEEEEEEEEEADEDDCTACEGTGENSKGKKCPICKGTGEKPEEEEEEEEEDEKPSRRKRKTKKDKDEEEEEEEEEEDEEEEEEEEEEDEPPRKRKSHRRKKK